MKRLLSLFSIVSVLVAAFSLLITSEVNAAPNKPPSNNAKKPDVEIKKSSGNSNIVPRNNNKETRPSPAGKKVAPGNNPNKSVLDNIIKNRLRAAQKNRLEVPPSENIKNALPQQNLEKNRLKEERKARVEKYIDENPDFIKRFNNPTPKEKIIKDRIQKYLKENPDIIDLLDSLPAVEKNAKLKELRDRIEQVGENRPELLEDKIRDSLSDQKNLDKREEARPENIKERIEGYLKENPAVEERLKELSPEEQREKMRELKDRLELKDEMRPDIHKERAERFIDNPRIIAEKLRAIPANERRKNIKEFKQNHPDIGKRMQEAKEKLIALPPNERAEVKKEIIEDFKKRHDARKSLLEERWNNASTEKRGNFCAETTKRCGTNATQGFEICSFVAKQCGNM